MVEVMNIMVTSFKRYHTCPAVCSAPNPAAGHHRRMLLLKTPGHSWASLGQSLVGSLLLSPESWCIQGSVRALQETVSPVLCNFRWLYGGVSATSSRRTYAIPRSTAPRAPAPVAVHCWPGPPQETLKHSSVSVSVQSLCPGVNKICLSPLWISGRYGVCSKCNFAPPTILLGLLLCPWMWGISSKSPQCHAPTAPTLHNCHSSNISPETSLRSLTKVYTVKAMVFPVVLYGCESWTTKKPESQRIDTFELWCWKKLLSTLESKEVKLVNLKGKQP